MKFDRGGMNEIASQSNYCLIEIINYSMELIERWCDRYLCVYFKFNIYLATVLTFRPIIKFKMILESERKKLFRKRNSNRFDVKVKLNNTIESTALRLFCFILCDKKGNKSSNNNNDDLFSRKCVPWFVVCNVCVFPVFLLI